MDDATTFLLAFGSVFAGIAYYLVWLERRAKALEARLATLASRSAVLEAQPKGLAAKANSLASTSPEVEARGLDAKSNNPDRPPTPKP